MIETLTWCMALQKGFFSLSMTSKKIVHRNNIHHLFVILRTYKNNEINLIKAEKQNYSKQNC